jgi:hypothetical protein
MCQNAWRKPPPVQHHSPNLDLGTLLPVKTRLTGSWRGHQNCVPLPSVCLQIACSRHFFINILGKPTTQGRPSTAGERGNKIGADLTMFGSLGLKGRFVGSGSRERTEHRRPQARPQKTPGQTTWVNEECCEVTKPYSEQLDDMDGQPWRSVLLPTPPTPSHTDTSVSTVQHCLLSRTFSLHQTTDNGCRAFIFPLVLSRCDTSINLKAKVPGEFEVKLRPTQAGKRSFLQPPKDKTETPILPHTHTHTHTHIPPWIFQALSFCGLHLVRACELPKFQGKRQGISKLNFFNGFLQMRGHFSAQAIEVTRPLHLSVVPRAGCPMITTGSIQTLNEVEKSSNKSLALFLQLMTA